MDFENKKQIIKNAMSECIDNVKDIEGIRKKTFFSDIGCIMSTLESNKERLERLSYQLEAEIAILEGKPDHLRTALLNLPQAYFPKTEHDSIYPQLISLQNYRDGFVSKDFNNFRLLIKLRTWRDCDVAEDIVRYDKHGTAIIKINPKDKATRPKTPGDILLEEKLLAVYDEVAQLKHANVVRLSR